MKLGVFLGGVIVFVAILVASYFFLFEDTANCTYEVQPLTIEDASIVNRVVKKFYNGIYDSSNDHAFDLGINEINSCFKMIRRGVPKFNGHALVTNNKLVIYATYEIPLFYFQKFLNVELILGIDGGKSQIEKCSMGKIRLPGSVMFYVATRAIDWGTGENLLEEVLSSIEVVWEKREVLKITFKETGEIKDKIERIKKRLRIFREFVKPYSEPDRVYRYYETLIHIDQMQPQTESALLIDYIEPLFAAVKLNGQDEVKENEAALLALSIFWGHERIASFIGGENYKGLLLYKKKHKSVTLQNRNDLALHFLISAALEILAKDNIAYSIGEFKELRDTLAGGSGYSFVDLSADLAGINFADVLTNSSSAQYAQDILAEKLEEKMFFPNTENLFENINREKFDTYYKNVDSDDYRRVVSEIRRYIKLLPINTLSKRE